MDISTRHSWCGIGRALAKGSEKSLLSHRTTIGTTKATHSTDRRYCKDIVSLFPPNPRILFDLLMSRILRFRFDRVCETEFEFNSGFVSFSSVSHTSIDSLADSLALHGIIVLFDNRRSEPIVRGGRCLHLFRSNGTFYILIAYYVSFALVVSKGKISANWVAHWVASSVMPR